MVFPRFTQEWTLNHQILGIFKSDAKIIFQIYENADKGYINVPTSKALLQRGNSNAFNIFYIFLSTRFEYKTLFFTQACFSTTTHKVCTALKTYGPCGPPLNKCRKKKLTRKAPLGNSLKIWCILSMDILNILYKDCSLRNVENLIKRVLIKISMTPVQGEMVLPDRFGLRLWHRHG